jgi:zinc protease
MQIRGEPMQRLLAMCLLVIVLVSGVQISGAQVSSAEARAIQDLKIKYEEFTLPNGLRVVVMPNTRAPVVTQALWYRVGSTVEKPGKTGLAHFLEHLMFKGTTKYPAGEYDRLMKENGAIHNAFTTSDYTGYYQRIASDKLELVIDIESDRMKNLVLTEADVLPERDVVKNERLQRIENDPSGPFWEKNRVALYGTHPYGRPVIGEMNDVASLTLQDALGFYRSYYQPRNAVLIISGDVDPAKARQLVEKYYGPLQNSPEAAMIEPLPVVSRPAGQRSELIDPRVTTPLVAKMNIAPNYVSQESREALALDFFTQIIGSGAESRLYDALVTKQGLAAHVGANTNLQSRAYGQVSIYAVPNPGVGIDKLEQALNQELKNILDTGITQAELDRQINRAYANLVYMLDDREAFAREAGIGVVLGLSPAEVFDTSAWATVTTDEVMAAARKHIVPATAITGVLMRNEADRTGAAK